jgi:hypothetical protein
MRVVVLRTLLERTAYGALRPEKEEKVVMTEIAGQASWPAGWKTRMLSFAGVSEQRPKREFMERRGARASRLPDPLPPTP